MPKFKIIKQVLMEATITAKSEEDARMRVFVLNIPEKKYKIVSEEIISFKVK